MNRSVYSKRLVILFGALLVLGLAPALLASGDDHPCSLRSVSGTFGYTISGNILAGPAAGPTAGAGIITLDKDGNLVNGSQTRSFNGAIADETTDGTYTA
ncbi:MAG: hypothetical protein M3R57_12510, partial [Chloroflexota bacterium]|nr:hypothetical protein [Chloroflexota bacterium]